MKKIIIIERNWTIEIKYWENNNNYNLNKSSLFKFKNVTGKNWMKKK